MRSFSDGCECTASRTHLSCAPAGVTTENMSSRQAVHGAWCQTKCQARCPTGRPAGWHKCSDRAGAEVARTSVSAGAAAESCRCLVLLRGFCPACCRREACARQQASSDRPARAEELPGCGAPICHWAAVPQHARGGARCRQDRHTPEPGSEHSCSSGTLHTPWHARSSSRLGDWPTWSSGPKAESGAALVSRSRSSPFSDRSSFALHAT